MSLPAAPSWRLTTIQWLEASPWRHHVGRDATAAAQLLRALRGMKFQLVESELAGESDATYRARISRLVDNWDGELHQQMRAFLEEGGYEAEKRQADALLDPAEKPKRTRRKKTTDEAPAPAEKVDDSAELEAIVLDEALAADPRLGAW